MKLRLLAVAAAAATCATASAFVAPSSNANAGPTRSIGPLHTGQPSAPCDAPEGVEAAPDLTSQPGSARLLRSNVVTNAEGDLVQLGESMGTGTSVVVFLRHMG
jgi:hypothetical protein